DLATSAPTTRSHCANTVASAAGRCQPRARIRPASTAFSGWGSRPSGAGPDHADPGSVRGEGTPPRPPGRRALAASRTAHTRRVPEDASPPVAPPSDAPPGTRSTAPSAVPSGTPVGAPADPGSLGGSTG